MVASAMARVLHLDWHHPEAWAIAEAAALLQAGQLVAMPTETVYGLAADATNPAAVAAIYAAKGRPAHNPLIVHVADVAMAKAWAAEWPDAAEALAQLWPGPLTLVLPARPGLAPAVLAGGSTVGLRVPAHPVARALIAAARRPLAAPSANPSNRLSPTLAQHVLDGLGDRIPLILDAGPCAVGLESTVVDPCSQPVRILRPGGWGPEKLSLALGGAPVETRPPGPAHAGPLPSPGLLSRHYAPQAKLHRAPTPEAALALALPGPLAILCAGPWPEALPLPPQSRLWVLPADAEGFGALLYASLHEADAWGAASSLVVGVPETGEAWAAVGDRLRRAQA